MTKRSKGLRTRTTYSYALKPETCQPTIIHGRPHDVFIEESIPGNLWLCKYGTRYGKKHQQVRYNYNIKKIRGLLKFYILVLNYQRIQIQDSV